VCLAAVAYGPSNLPDGGQREAEGDLPAGMRDGEREESERGAFT